jgi:hypothetical protein
MENPVIILKFLEPSRYAGPELATGTFVDSANRVVGRWDWIDPIAIQLADKRLVDVSNDHFSLLRGCD